MLLINSMEIQCNCQLVEILIKTRLVVSGSRCWLNMRSSALFVQCRCWKWKLNRKMSISSSNQWHPLNSLIARQPLNNLFGTIRCNKSGGKIQLASSPLTFYDRWSRRYCIIILMVFYINFVHDSISDLISVMQRRESSKKVMKRKREEKEPSPSLASSIASGIRFHSVEKILRIIIYHTHMICTFIAFHCSERNVFAFPLLEWYAMKFSFNQISRSTQSSREGFAPFLFIEVIGNWSNIISSRCSM